MKLTLKETYLHEEADDDYISAEKAAEVALFYKKAKKIFDKYSEEMSLNAGWVKDERSAPYMATSPKRMREELELALTLIKSGHDTYFRSTTSDEKGSRDKENKKIASRFGWLKKKA